MLCGQSHGEQLVTSKSGPVIIDFKFSQNDTNCQNNSISKENVDENRSNTMFIFVVYKDAPELSVTLRRSSSEIDLAVEKTLLVNPNCPVRIMLEYIRKKCRLGSFTTFDLCDDNGTLKGLFSLETFAYATDLFEHKKMYYVIVVKQETDKLVSVLPQLNHENQIYQNLKEKCKKYLNGEISPSSTPLNATPVKATPAASRAVLKKK